MRGEEKIIEKTRFSPWLKMVVFEGERYSVDAMFVLLSSENWVWIILCWGWIIFIGVRLFSLSAILFFIGVVLFSVEA